jgi:hypothetical protein
VHTSDLAALRAAGLVSPSRDSGGGGGGDLTRGGGGTEGVGGNNKNKKQKQNSDGDEHTRAAAKAGGARWHPLTTTNQSLSTAELVALALSDIGQGPVLVPPPTPFPNVKRMRRWGGGRRPDGMTDFDAMAASARGDLLMVSGEWRVASGER